MKKKFYTVCILSIINTILYTFLFCGNKNVILIGWDGAQREHLKECLSRGELPNLQKLISEGNIVKIDVLRVTDTKSGWAQILTGYEPEKTGVFSNSDYQPIPKGYTIFERLEEYFGKDNIVTVAVISKKSNLGTKPEQKIELEKFKNKKNKNKKKNIKIVEENGKKYVIIPGEPYYYTAQNVDVFINGLGEDKNVGEKTLELLERYKDKHFFFFVHFGDIDHNGHKFGENSKQYNDAFISADFWLGKIVDKLRQLGIYNNTLIYITADHGFDEGKKKHTDAPYVFLATNDKEVKYSGTRADITPTIYDRLGIDIKKFSPPLDGRSLTKPVEQIPW